MCANSRAEENHGHNIDSIPNARLETRLNPARQTCREMLGTTRPSPISLRFAGFWRFLRQREDAEDAASEIFF